MNYTVRKHQEMGQNKSKSQFSRLKAKASSKDNFISLQDRKLTVPNITEQLNQCHEKNVSTSIVGRRLWETGLYGRIAVKKPLLRKQINVKRLQWAKIQKEQWNKVLWTDKSKSKIFGSNRRVYIQLRVVESAASPCTTPTVKHGQGSVMVWESFTNCKVDLHQVKSKLNQISYHSILQYHAIPSRKWLVAQGFVLIQDNDPNHTRKLCQRYIKSKEGQHILQLMSWLVQSTDINPIEQVWDEFDWKVRAKQSTSAAHYNILPGKLGRTIFSLPPVFGRKNAENL